MPRVITSAAAEADAEEIWRWIANDSIRAADRLVNRFEEVAHLLAQRPEMGRSRDELAHGLRSFAVGSYLLFYRPIREGIEVARVLHGRRDIGPDLF
ncbi:MAG: type II toxin-antitoxin system RelE/ParE family toxin [Ignavibacteriales bacterium]